MFYQKRSLFRQESLERLSSPERLNQLLQVVSPKSWIALASLGTLVGATFIWSIYGRIPITVEGKGVLIYPRQVVPLQSTSAGQLLALNVKVGDIVKKGQLLATLDQNELQKKLQQQRAKLGELQSQSAAASLLQGKGSTQETKTIQQQRQNAQQRIAELETLTPVLRQKSRESIQKQRQRLEQRITELQALAPKLKEKSLASLKEQRLSLSRQIRLSQEQLPLLQKKVAKRRQLLEEKVITEDVLYQAEQEYLKKAEELAQLEAQTKDIAVKETETEERYINNLNEISSNRSELQKLSIDETNAEETYLKNLNEIAQLRAQLKELDSREANLAKQNLQDSNTRNREIQEVKREIAQLELQLRTNSQIISQQNGRILEITVTPGQVVNLGTRLGSIDEENSASKLVGITYFSVADGKKIKSDMSLQITPQIVKRERFGGIVGTVTAVSSFPITKEAAVSVVGNPEMVEGLVSQKTDGVIQVFATLELDKTTASGYKWSSSQGPAIDISPGITTVVRVKVEERAPITYIFPILRSVSGIY